MSHSGQLVCCSLCQTMSQDIDTLRHVSSERCRPETSRGLHRFTVRSLGWTVLDAGLDLTSLDNDDHCVQSRVNKSISRLSVGRHDMTDVMTS